MPVEKFIGVAHGRVNLIGEHTDYNGGWVLPTVIPQYTRVELTLRNDRKVTVSATPDPKTGVPRYLEYFLGSEQKEGNWGDYFMGATHLLAQKGFKIGGFSAVLDSTVPEGSGLSSSAALEMSFLDAVRKAFDLPIDGFVKANLGQSVENEFVGAHVGIMDQVACSFARSGEALFLDTRDLSYERIPLPSSLIDLIVINSGLTHQNSGGDYNQRRAECEKACELLKIGLLRDLGEDGLEQIEKLPEPFRRRARHVFTENARVHAAVAAIRARNPYELGRLFYESHASMRDDYAVSIPEIDLLVELCKKEKSVFGARLTGGGFGGSIVAICESGKAREIGERVISKYNQDSRHQATLLVPAHL